MRHRFDQGRHVRTEVVQRQAEQAGRSPGLLAQPLLPVLPVAQYGVQRVCGLQQFAGLVGFAGVVVNRLSAGAEAIKPGEQIRFASLAMRSKPLRLGGGLTQVLLHLIKAHVLAPQAFGLPFFKGGLPITLPGQLPPSAFKRGPGGSECRSRAHLHHAFQIGRDQVLATLDFIHGFQQGVQVVGAGLALYRVLN
ncbi:hypothetical protein D3C77_286240 [compost metagenome]